MGDKHTKPRSSAKQALPLRLEWIEAGSLSENPLNWRRHSQEQLEGIRELLQDSEVGWAGACLFNERTGRLVDGHARKQVVDPATPVPVLVGNWSPEAEAKILATLDPVGAMAAGDPAAYAKLVEMVQADGLIDSVRIAARSDAIVKPPEKSVIEVMHETSRHADVVFVGLMTPPEGEEGDYADRLIELVEHLPTTVLVRNSGPFEGRLLS